MAVFLSVRHALDLASPRVAHTTVGRAKNPKNVQKLQTFTILKNMRKPKIQKC